MRSLAPHLCPSPEAIAIFKQTGELDVDLCCPITRGELVQPVRIGPAGKHLFSEAALVRWASDNPVDPMTRRPLDGQRLIREPSATAAINALRRGAARLHLEEGNAQQAEALYRQAAACEAKDRQTPAWAQDAGHSVFKVGRRSALLCCRLVAGLCAAVWWARGVYLWGRPSSAPSWWAQASQAGGMTSLLGLSLQISLPHVYLGLCVAWAGAAASGLVLPASAHLIGAALGAGVLALG